MVKVGKSLATAAVIIIIGRQPQYTLAGQIDASGTIYARSAMHESATAIPRRYRTGPACLDHAA